MLYVCEHLEYLSSLLFYYFLRYTFKQTHLFIKKSKLCYLEPETNVNNGKEISEND